LKLKAAVMTAALSLCTLHFSPAVASLSLFLFFLSLITQLNKERLSVHKTLLLFTLLWCLSQFAIQLGLGYDHEAMRKLLIRLPLVFLPLIWCVQPIASVRFVALLLLAVGIVHTWIGGASVLNYFAHYRFLNQMVLESKPLPLFSSVYHIEFSLILAIVSLLQISFLRVLDKPSLRWLMAVSMLLNIVCLHVLSARTGILAFWLGLPFLLKGVPMPNMLSGRKKWILMMLPVLLIIVVPSLRNRVKNTFDDLMAVKQSQNLSDKSFGRRWEAWKVAAAAINEHPWSGAGFSGVENAMFKGFEKKQSYLHVTDRIKPHNQFLELALQTGVVTLLLFCIWLIMLFRHYWRLHNYAAIAVLMALMISMFFESYMERQSGVAVFVVALFFVLFTEKKE
jgi:O-antigen ligase